jgi:hypothetical protein
VSRIRFATSSRLVATRGLALMAIGAGVLSLALGTGSTDAGAAGRPQHVQGAAHDSTLLSGASSATTNPLEVGGAI